MANLYERALKSGILAKHTSLATCGWTTNSSWAIILPKFTIIASIHSNSPNGHHRRSVRELGAGLIAPRNVLLQPVVPRGSEHAAVVGRAPVLVDAGVLGEVELLVVVHAVRGVVAALDKQEQRFTVQTVYRICPRENIPY